MKKFFKIFSVLFLAGFSFYYTEKIAAIMKSKDKLMIEINNIKDKYSIDYVNAILEGNTIIPGINGLQINSDKSYANMKAINVFNEYYLKYDQIKPEVSLMDNLNKVIIRGNKQKNAVSFVVKSNEKINQYLIENNYNIDYQNICIIDFNENCEEKHLKVKATINLNHNNVFSYKKEIQAGDIIIIDENLSVDEIKIILEEIKYRDIKIMSLNELISEENNIN